MTFRRYSVQFRSSFEGWKYFGNRLFWTRRGAAKLALKLALDKRALCTYRVMKTVKGSDVEVLFLHRTANKPFCNCGVNPGSRRARKHYPK
jgi:hypothetical protein